MNDVAERLAREALERIARKMEASPVPALTDEEFAALDPLRKAIMTCNMPGCRKVVSTHGLVCVEHL
jgi:hypothetical protein